MMFETKLFDEPFRQLLFDFFMRNSVSAVDVIYTFLNRCHEFHAISNLINRCIIGKLLNGF